MQTIALGWLVLHLSHNSGFAVGLVIALQFLPTLLFGAWGGVIADRFDKRNVLFVTQIVDGDRSPVLLAVLDRHRRRRAVDGLRDRPRSSAARRRSTTRPATSFVSEMVPEDGAARTRSGSTARSSSSPRIVGPAIAGVLIVVIGTGPCFA